MIKMRDDVDGSAGAVDAPDAAASVRVSQREITRRSMPRTT
jgi:hypothetical protein